MDIDQNDPIYQAMIQASKKASKKGSNDSEM